MKEVGKSSPIAMFTYADDDGVVEDEEEEEEEEAEDQDGSDYSEEG